MNGNDATKSVEELNREISDLSSGAQILAQDMKTLFDGMSGVSISTEKLSKSFSNDISNAISDVIIKGDDLSDSLRSLALTMADRALSAAIQPIAGLISGGISNLVTGVLPFENGGIIQNGNVQAFSSGGIVNGPTNFPLRGGVGLMGEAGPEAIMPLKRGSDGKLGVVSESNTASPTNVTINISTPDIQSFQRTQSQIASKLVHAIQKANKNR